MTRRRLAQHVARDSEARQGASGAHQKSLQGTNANDNATAKRLVDFNAALQLQYARFANDTNRCITANDTNYLAHLPPRDLRDFVCDLKNTRRGRTLRPGEYSLVFDLVKQRLNDGLGTPQWSFISDMLCDLAELGAHHNEQGVLDIPAVWLDYASQQSTIAKDFRWFKQVLAGLTFPLEDIQDEKLMCAYANRCSNLLKQYADHPLVRQDVERQTQVKFHEACMEGFADADAGFAKLSDMEADFRQTYKNNKRWLDAFKWNKDGMQAGMSGKELLNYVKQHAEEERKNQAVNLTNKEIRK